MYTKSEWRVMPIALLIILTITFILWIWLKNKSQKIKDIPFFIVALLLLLGEVAKQCVGLLDKDGYDTWWIPLHFCSTYFVWFSFAEFSRGIRRRAMQSIAFTATTYVVVGMYAMPRSILASACDHIFLDFLTCHSFFFHHLVVLYFFLTLAFKRFQPVKADGLLWMVCMTVYFLTATAFAYLLDTNYYNILYSNIPFIESLRATFGQFVYTLGLGTVTVLSGAVLLRVCVVVKEKIKKK